MPKARVTAKAYYDKQSSNMTLDLRHATENKLLARWEGPFIVTRQLSMVNYEIMTDEGPKVYHINLLRIWHTRESDVSIPQVHVIQTAEPCEENYETLGHIDDDGEDAELRQINAITIADKYPASDMRLILEKAAGAKFIIALDLRQVYFQVELDQESRPYTAFRSNQGLYQYTLSYQRQHMTLWMILLSSHPHGKCTSSISD